MKRIVLTIALCIFGASVLLNAAEVDELKYYDALQFRMINKGYADDYTLTPYTRIPAYLKDSVEVDLWDRAKNSSGYGIRFASNSKAVGIKYELTNNFHMNHMAPSGIKGADLYILDNGVWEHVNSVRPADKKDQNAVFVSNLDGKMHEFMVYLPLYDGVEWMQIGVDPDATITKPLVDNPRSHKKIVFYGTSILQGGCASRPGMVATNMIQRDMNLECVNIGISGQGKMYEPMARAMTQIEDVVAYVVDPVPNCTLGQCDTLTVGFINILRKAHPEVPIIMVEGPMYPYAKYDSYFENYLPQKNAAFHKRYEELLAENPKSLYYVTCEGLTGPHEEGTVDGIHLTDFGFRAYADKLEVVLKQVLGE